MNKKQETQAASVDRVVSVRQYYYHVDSCRAESAKHADCVCWHDEGVGPMPEGCWYDKLGNRRELEWREKAR